MLLLIVSGSQCWAQDVQPDSTQQPVHSSTSQRFDQDGFYKSAGALLPTSTQLEDYLAVATLLLAVLVWFGFAKLFRFTRKQMQSVAPDTSGVSRKFAQFNWLLLAVASLLVLQAASIWLPVHIALTVGLGVLAIALWKFNGNLTPLLLTRHIEKADEGDEHEFERLRDEVQQCDMTLHAVLDSINEGIVAIDTEGEFTCFNYWAREILARGAVADLEPLQWAENYPMSYARDDSPVAPDDFPLLRAMQGEFVSDWELIIERNGQRRIINVNATPLCNSGAGAAVMVLQDITDLKLAEAELEQQHRLVQKERRLLDTIVESLPHAVFWKDKESNYLGCNSTFARMAGRSGSDELRGLNDYQLHWPKRDADFYRECDQRVMAGEQQIHDMEETRVNPDGEERILWTSKLRMVDDAGEVVGIVGCFSDVTDYRTAENERNRLNTELQKVSRQAGMAEIATGVLHNVGNVINSVNVAATTLQRGFESRSLGLLQRTSAILLENEQRLVPFFTEDRQGKLFPSVLNELVQQMHHEIESWREELSSLREHLNHLREVVATQQKSAKEVNSFEHNDMQKLLRDAVKMSGVDRASGIDLVDHSETLQPIATCGHKVLQILVNLLTNAKNAIAESPRKTGTITIRLFLENELLSLSITDTGVGINQESLQKLFTHGFTTRKSGHG
ncbi:MAG: PAS domain-containing protein, partial [Planctomycetota bacterium]